MNDGTELRINRIRHSDLSDYTCVARNGEGRIHHTVKVVIAGREVLLAYILAVLFYDGDFAVLFRLMFIKIFGKEVYKLVWLF